MAYKHFVTVMVVLKMKSYLSIKQYLKRILLKNDMSLNGISKKIEHFVDFNNGYFVELGANDGLSQSNTYYFEKNRGWNGVLIEPSPNKFMECVSNRSSLNQIFCAACVSFSYNDHFVPMNYCDLMTVSKSLETDIDDVQKHLEFGKEHLKRGEESFQFGALARTLTSILDEANAPRVVDFLSLDVEGAEIEVLKGIDFNKYEFKFLLVESRCVSKVEKLLSSFGYNKIEKISPHDFLFAPEKTR